MKQAGPVPQTAPPSRDKMICPLCGSLNIRDAIRKDPFLKKCGACRIVFTHPFPRTSGEVYDEKYYRIWHEEQAAKRLKLWARRLRTVKRFCSAGPLLDIGTGDGLFLRFAREAGFDVFGTEISPTAVAAAKKMHGLSVELAAIEETNFRDNFFEAITVWHVIEHVQNPRGLISKSYQLLKPGGFLFCATPNLNKNLSRAYFRAAHLRPFPFYSSHGEQHVFHFTEDTLRNLVEKAGFKVKLAGVDFAAVRPKYQLFEVLSFILSSLIGRNWNENLLLVAQK